MRDEVCAVVMAKLPAAGRVKTRLVPPLTPEQAAAVHHVFVRETLERLLGALPAADIARAAFFVDPPDAVGEAQRRYGDFGGLGFHGQVAGDLGDRLIAAREQFGQDQGALFVGCDSPDLPVTHIIEAERLLRRRALILGPCDDGGFWCLGVAAAVDLRPVLAGVEWSSGREMAQVRRNAEAAGLSVALAGQWCDVDHPADLAKLLVRLENAPRGGPLLDALATLLPRKLLDVLRAVGRTNPETT